MKPSACDRLAAYFKAQPNVWISGVDLARVGGLLAWRTRASDLRKRGMVIENRVEHHDGTVRSFYRYVPSEPAETGTAPGHNLNAWELR
jgi:hypothetical protein